VFVEGGRGACAMAQWHSGQSHSGRQVLLLQGPGTRGLNSVFYGRRGAMPLPIILRLLARSCPTGNHAVRACYVWSSLKSSPECAVSRQKQIFVKARSAPYPDLTAAGQISHLKFRHLPNDKAMYPRCNACQFPILQC